MVDVNTFAEIVPVVTRAVAETDSLKLADLAVKVMLCQKTYRSHIKYPLAGQSDIELSFCSADVNECLKWNGG